jgi:pimeloyl-ACP methyl ester carboxylesterase
LCTSGTVYTTAIRYACGTMRTIILAAAALLVPQLAPGATVDGARIHFSKYGKGPKTVVFIHGWTCNESTWSPQVPVFEKNYRVITIDLPGHGKSEFPKGETLSMDVFARAIEAVRAEVKVDRIALVGHSMGAAVIWQYAVRYPRHVAALVPVDGALVLGPPPGPGGRGNADLMKGEQGLKTRENMVNGMVANATPEVKEKVRKMMLADASERTAVEAALAMWGPKETGGPFDFPGLGIYAGHESRTLMPELPNSKVVLVEGTGHFIMLEKPGEFNKLLGDFLATVKF